MIKRSLRYVEELSEGVQRQLALAYTAKDLLGWGLRQKLREGYTRHDFRAGRSRYETVPDEHHDHLIDLRSGQVIEFRNEEIERLQQAIAEKLGFRLVDHRLELYAVPLEQAPDGDKGEG